MGKQQPAADDLEERRRVTRELNEATRDARTATRDLKAVLDQVDTIAEQTVRNLINGKVDEINMHMAHLHSQVQELITGYEAQARDHYTKLLGHDTPGALIGAIAQNLEPVISQTLEGAMRRVITELFGQVQQHGPDGSTVYADVSVDLPDTWRSFMR